MKVSDMIKVLNEEGFDISCINPNSGLALFKEDGETISVKWGDKVVDITAKGNNEIYLKDEDCVDRITDDKITRFVHDEVVNYIVSFLPSDDFTEELVLDSVRYYYYKDTKLNSLHIYEALYEIAFGEHVILDEFSELYKAI